MNAHHEHEFEAAPGLPEPLPQGERLIWQGSPDWVQLAIHAFHVRKLAVYFGLMLALQWIYLQGESQVAMSLLTSAVLALTALGLLALTAWFSARTTLYTLTDRRVVMRIGVVLSITLNLPLKRIAAAAIKPQAGGHGDIALSLAGTDRIAYLNLWPHARAWQLKRPEPSLRCVPGAARVAERIQQAWSAANPGVLARMETPDTPHAQPRSTPTHLTTSGDRGPGMAGAA